MIITLLYWGSYFSLKICKLAIIYLLFFFNYDYLFLLSGPEHESFPGGRGVNLEVAWKCGFLSLSPHPTRGMIIPT